MFITLGLVLVTLFLIFFFRFIFPIRCLSRRSRRLLEKIPGPRPLPLLGNELEFSTPHEELCKLYLSFYHKYGNVYKYITIGRPTVVLSHYNDIEGKKWHTRRKILTPTFHFKILEENIPLVNENVGILVEKLKSQSDSDLPVDIHSFITLFSLDVICETAMGVSVNAQQEGSEYVKSLRRISHLIHQRIFHCWLWSDFIFSLSSSGKEHKQCLEVLHGFTNKNVMRFISGQYVEKARGPAIIVLLCDVFVNVSDLSFQVIQERQAEYMGRGSDELYTKLGKKRLAFLDMLIEMSERDGTLTDSDIREEVDTFMFEGHDTVSTALSWALFLLGFHPEIQEKACEELRSIFGDSDRQTTWDDLQKMKYLEQIIKEALRIYPSVPAFARENTVDINIGKYVIPAGTEILFFPYLIHRNEDVFPEPEKFNPDHFSPEKCAKRHPFAYLPFSAGPRNCIGQRFAMIEEKIVLSSILRNFKLESCGSTEETVPLLDLVLKPKEPVMIKLFSRN